MDVSLFINGRLGLEKKIFLLKAVRLVVGMSYHVTCFDMFLLDFGNCSGTTSSFPIKMLETI